MGDERRGDQLLVRLSSDVGDATIVDRFVIDYLSLLDARLDTLRELLAEADTDSTRLAILSLESSSAMLGANELVAAARALRQAVTGGRQEPQPSLFAAVITRADQLRTRLGERGFVSRSVAG